MNPQAKNVGTPDEKVSFEHGELSLVNMPGITVAQAVFRPGWRWSTDVKPRAGTSSCQVAHTAYVISGRLAVRTDDGAEAEFGPGDVHMVGPGHDAWVVGDEPCVIVDFGSVGHPTKPEERIVRCPCGVEFRAASEAHLDHLVAAVQEHAAGSHDHAATREHILSEIVSA